MRAFAVRARMAPTSAPGFVPSMAIPRNGLDGNRRKSPPPRPSTCAGRTLPVASMNARGQFGPRFAQAVTWNAKKFAPLEKRTTFVSSLASRANLPTFDPGRVVPASDAVLTT
jgi:hypothetical protein